MYIRRFFLLAVLVFCLSITGCIAVQSFDTVIELKPGEDWTVTMTIAFDQTSLQMYGADVTQSMNEMVSQIEQEQEGVEASWEQGKITDDGTIPYIIRIDGRGITDLDNPLFSGEGGIIQHQVDGKNRIDISIPAGVFNVEANQVTVTLKGGKILSTNGEKVNNTTVKWVNPGGSLNVTMEEPKSSLHWLVFLLIAAVVGIGLTVVAGGGMMLFLRRGKAKSSASPSYPGYVPYSAPAGSAPEATAAAAPISAAPVKNPTSSGLRTTIPSAHRTAPSGTLRSAAPLATTSAPATEQKYCPSCGTAWKPGARFCTNCGYKG